MTYDEWEKIQPFSPVSPEGYYAELAWNAAISQSTDEKLKALHTGFHGTKGDQL